MENFGKYTGVPGTVYIINKKHEYPTHTYMVSYYGDSYKPAKFRKGRAYDVVEIVIINGEKMGFVLINNNDSIKNYYTLIGYEGVSMKCPHPTLALASDCLAKVNKNEDVV